MVGLTNATGGGNMAYTPIAAIYGHTSGSTSYVTPLNSVRVSYNRDYFTYSSGVFTAKQKCSVVIAAFTSPRYNANNGHDNTATHKILINGTTQGGESTAVATTLSYTLNSGDTVQYQCKGSTAGAIAGGIGIRFA